MSQPHPGPATRKGLSALKGSTTRLLLIAIGAIFILMGIFALSNPLQSYLKLVRYLGIALLLNGVLLLIVSMTPMQFPRECRWLQAESIAHFLFAIILMINPVLSFVALPYIVGLWIFTTGVLKMGAALALRKFLRGWIFILAAGAISVIFGLLLLNNPFEKAIGITILIGAFAVMTGAIYMIDAFRYRDRKEGIEILL